MKYTTGMLFYEFVLFNNLRPIITLKSSIILTMSQSFHLYQLQKIDTQFDQGTARILEIKTKIESDTRLQEQQQIVDQAQKNLSTEQSALKKIEQDVNSRRIKLEQSEASLYGGKVRAPKELQDLQNEVAAIKRAISHLEDLQLEAMLKVEEAQAVLDQAQNRLEQVKVEVEAEFASLTAESVKIKSLMDRLQLERAAVVEQIDQTLLAEYERMRKVKRGLAVATLMDNACTGCGTILPPADSQTARSPNQIFHCPSCGRFIYAG